VLAYRIPEDETSWRNQAQDDFQRAGRGPAALTDGKLDQAGRLSLQRRRDGTWIQFEFAKPWSAHAFSIAVADSFQFPNGRLNESRRQPLDKRSLIWVCGLQVCSYSFPKAAPVFFAWSWIGLANRLMPHL